ACASAQIALTPCASASNSLLWSNPDVFIVPFPQAPAKSPEPARGLIEGIARCSGPTGFCYSEGLRTLRYSALRQSEGPGRGANLFERIKLP
ncbi:MAG: hypothetical protein DMG37_10400, partial [Acidobacteria bacterium]